MRVVFLEDVEGVAQGGEVKEVKNGFARNYLIPKSLAVPATHNALQQIQSIAQKADDDRTRTLTDLRALGDIVEGTLINIEMRSGVNNRLYGSVTNAVLADELSKITDREIDRRTVILAEPIRELGLFEVTLRLHQDVEVPISVLVYPIGADPEAALAAARGEDVAEQESTDESDTESTEKEEAEEPADENDSEGAEEAVTEEPEATIEEDAAEEPEASDEDEDVENESTDESDKDEEASDEPEEDDDSDDVEEADEDKKS